jgi:hypothetical protein
MEREHARRHASNRSREQRARIAHEAARLISEHGIRDYHQAKLKAAERLGVRDEQCLPANREVEDALREYQRIFRPGEQARALRARREAAVEALRFFARFDPRLVGAVLDGTADEHSAVCLHLYSDDPTAVRLFLEEHRIPYAEQTRRLRVERERWQEYPVYLFSADELPIDLTVLPHDALRQPPLDRIDEKPMRRAALAAALELLDE